MEDNKKIYNLQSLSFLQGCKLKIGILGGSFNPAHDGHLSISLAAIKKYHFDYVIWCVANQNPDKEKYKDDIETRCIKALKIIHHPRIIVSSIEKDLGIYYTYDLIKELLKRFSTINFTWLMGIDNTRHFCQWYRALDIMRACPMIIFDRPSQLRLVNNIRFAFNYNQIVDKAGIMPIIIDRSVMNHNSSTIIRAKGGVND
jgi:nicotinate-nucleotide adenylyltransferase